MFNCQKILMLRFLVFFLKCVQCKAVVVVLLHFPLGQKQLELSF